MPSTSAQHYAGHLGPNSAKLEYATWLAREIVTRRDRYPVAGARPSLAILTTVYPRTNPALLRDLSDSLQQQILPFSQWVIVAHGALPATLEAVLLHIAQYPDARVERVAGDLSIMRAMKRAFDLATADYVVPVDSDDLLTLDALHVFASVLAHGPRADLLYSDEDLLVEGRPMHPCRRPDFDPVLNDETSYIWHLTAIRRETGIALGVFTDEAATWTHDWDTAHRMQQAGACIVHVPEVLYHWRQHPVSLSNSGTGNTEQMKSVRHILERRIALTANPAGFEVVDFPISRGGPIPELYIARRSTEIAPVVVVASEAGGSAKHTISMVGVGGLDATASHASFGDALGAVLAAATDLVGFVGDDIMLDDWPAVLNEAHRLFELHADLAGVGGRLIGEDGCVSESCFVSMPDGSLLSPQVGLAAGDPGAFALALKPHSVVVPGPRLALFARSFLDSNRAALQVCTTREAFVLLASKLAFAQGRRMAFSPLVSARVCGAQRVTTMAGASPGELPQNLGLSFYAAAAQWHA